MKDLRLSEPLTSKSWEKAGWPREPRNGHEWKLLAAGKPCPTPTPGKRHFPKRYKCRTCGGTNYGVQEQNGSTVRYCLACRARHKKNWRDANPLAQMRRSRAFRKKHREMVFEEVDGYIDIPWGALILRPQEVFRLVDAGKKIVVDYQGIPVCALVRLEEA